jgi:hypothetical protein
VNVGCASSRQATTPASSGVESEVPLTNVVQLESEFAHTVAVETPVASSSGFGRTSAVGPSEENEAMTPAESTAPAVITSSASAGAISVDVAGFVSCPKFPAAVTHGIPLSVAAFTASVVTAVWPSRSDCVYQSM